MTFSQNSYQSLLNFQFQIYKNFGLVLAALSNLKYQTSSKIPDEQNITVFMLESLYIQLRSFEWSWKDSIAVSKNGNLEPLRFKIRNSKLSDRISSDCTLPVVEPNPRTGLCLGISIRVKQCAIECGPLSGL